MIRLRSGVRCECQKGIATLSYKCLLSFSAGSSRDPDPTPSNALFASSPGKFTSLPVLSSPRFRGVLQHESLKFWVVEQPTDTIVEVRFQVSSNMFKSEGFTLMGTAVRACCTQSEVCNDGCNSAHVHTKLAT